MKFIPHPAALAALSAATGRRLQGGDVDDAGVARPKSSVPRPYTAKGVAAYRWPDGRIGVAHDMYAPEHPEGTEPGLADVRYEVRHYPNDTSGYHPHVMNFLSVPDLEATGMRVDRTAAGLIMRDDRAALLINPDEWSMSRSESKLVEDVSLIRAPIRHVDIDAGGCMNLFVSTYTRGGGLEIMAATEEGALHEALAERYKFIPKGEDLGEFSANLRRHAHQHGWVVCETDEESSRVAAAAFEKIPDSDYDSPQF